MKEKIIGYIYESHHSEPLYVTAEEVSDEDLYCEACGDEDVLIGTIELSKASRFDNNYSVYLNFDEDATNCHHIDRTLFAEIDEIVESYAVTHRNIAINF